MIVMSNNLYNDTFFDNRMKWDYLQGKIISNENLHDILSFHQSTVNYGNNFKINNGSQYELNVWLQVTEYTDILPEYVNNQVDFNINIKEIESSTRSFENEFCISKDAFGEILYCAFGRDSQTLSKPYPSAGALYPVFPIIYILSNDVVESIEQGCYIFDSKKIKLLQIKQFNNRDINNIKSATFVKDNFPSNIVIGYGIDIRRSITKYGRRGYRHALIEVGLAAQSFRESYRKLNNSEYGDLCWSGFSDNRLTYESGLNVRLSPIVLLQWFGRKVKSK